MARQLQANEATSSTINTATRCSIAFPICNHSLFPAKSSFFYAVSIWKGVGLVTSKYTLRSTSMYMCMCTGYKHLQWMLRGQIGKRFKLLICTSMLVRAALVLLLAPLCLCAGKEPQSEERVYKTKEWKDSSRTLILTKQSSFDFMGSLVSF